MHWFIGYMKQLEKSLTDLTEVYYQPIQRSIIAIVTSHIGMKSLKIPVKVQIVCVLYQSLKLKFELYISDW